MTSLRHAAGTQDKCGRDRKGRLDCMVKDYALSMESIKYVLAVTGGCQARNSQDQTIF